MGGPSFAVLAKGGFHERLHRVALSGVERGIKYFGTGRKNAESRATHPG